MTMHCCLCGRALGQPAVLIGQMPVGPTCARRAGLVELAKKSNRNLVRPGPALRHAMTPAQRDQMDLFDEVAHA